MPGSRRGSGIISLVIRRLYIHKFRCLENFELSLAGLSSVLLIGNNGSGKTTVRLALEILQRIARGTNRVGDLVKSKDFTGGSTSTMIKGGLTPPSAGFPSV
jgi:predicted ATPase